MLFTRQTGALVRSADNPGHELVVGLLLAGSVTLSWPDSELVFREGQIVVALPGDAVVQGSHGVEGITFRFPVHDFDLFRLQAVSDKARRQFARTLASDSATNLGSLLRFVAGERDRVHRAGGDDPSPYLLSLASVVRQVIIDDMYRSLALPVLGGAEDCRSCARVDDLLRSHPYDTFTTAQLAYHAKVSVRQLYRDFESAVGTSPRDYVHRVRLQAARFEILKDLAPTGALRESPWARAFSGYGGFVRHYMAEFGEHPEESVAKRAELLARKQPSRAAAVG